MGVQSLGREDPLEEGMAIHSSILAWEIPWIKEPGGLQSRGSQRIRHDSVTKQQQHGDQVSDQGQSPLKPSSVSRPADILSSVL